MNILNRVLKPINVQVKKFSSLEEEKVNYERRLKRVSEFYVDASFTFNDDLNDDITAIVFSKDRAMQLHALLFSYFFYTKNHAPLVVLYTFSNDLHKKAYDLLKVAVEDYPVTFFEETCFTEQLKSIVQKLNAGRIFFMTDDGVFLDHYDLQDSLHFHPAKSIFSLRLGADLDFCYSYNKKQDVPAFAIENVKDKKFNSWVWAGMKDSPDWIYPLSVDATIFLKKEIEMILENISFKSPNSLESQLQLYNDLFTYRAGICYSKVKYANVPCNIVQSEYANNFTGAFSVNELLDHFLNGKRIDWRKLEQMNAREAQLIKYTFI